MNLRTPSERLIASALKNLIAAPKQIKKLHRPILEAAVAFATTCVVLEIAYDLVSRHGGDLWMHIIFPLLQYILRVIG